MRLQGLRMRLRSWFFGLQRIQRLGFDPEILFIGSARVADYRGARHLGTDERSRISLLTRWHADAAGTVYVR